MNSTRKRLHAGAFQHNCSDVGMCLTKIETNLHYLLFRLIIVNLRAFGPLFVIR